VSFTPRPHYRRGKSQVSIGEEAGWALKSRSGRNEDKNTFILPLPGNKPGRPTRPPHQLNYQTKQTPWFQSASELLPTERPPLVGEVSANFR
jgi:hypothetical protein